ncbi:RNA-processing protein HAT helix [Venturia nashicola]|uniref:RNA-processing protein HAT helix n=1 Tax=Venturia nashicola TaxID=86259 RepID=A0A4Z1P3M4_9PEZI|nr:RNA-processing protein HAT helix [Venturia nashicola]TLD20231.1 RNA-processing protein HAT helix [Venturia nashicola]
MSSSSDKARFYLEQQVPELQEFLRKKIFTEPQVKAIAQKRSSFEHILNARGSTPSDYARYAEYEQNLESLRKKRCTRLLIKGTGHAGQRKIFFILDRGVRKFPGDLKLWMQYLGFCRKEKATKKIKEVLTRLLRLHPTKAELWVYAARYAIEEEGDMTGARGYMQRGLRFCEMNRGLWVEYARLECIYVAKIATRRRILGVDGIKETMQQEMDSEDMMRLPQVTEEDINPELQESGIDEDALQKLENTPAITGAIPIAIITAAFKKFNDDPRLGEQFFDMVAEFQQTSAFNTMLNHIITSMLRSKPDAIETIACHLRSALIGIDPDEPTFPAAIGDTLRCARSSMARLPLLKVQIAERTIPVLLPYALDPKLDTDIQRVLSSSLRSFVREIGNPERVADLVDCLVEHEEQDQARRLLETSIKVNGSHARLMQAHAALNAVVSA